jgi:dihydrofolate reductase
MGTLSAFEFLTLDGYYAGPNGEIDWFKQLSTDPEFEAHTRQESQEGSALLLGRVTYEMMRSYWPTPAAIAADPAMARVMNESPKIVVSKTLDAPGGGANWRNVTIARAIDGPEIQDALRHGNLTVLGSGTIVQQLLRRHLLDGCQLVIVPLVLGAGKALFHQVPTTSLQLVSGRSYGNGVALLTYRTRAR